MEKMYGITQFNGKEYKSWQFRLKSVLLSEKLWSCAEKYPPVVPSSSANAGLSGEADEQRMNTTSKRRIIIKQEYRISFVANSHLHYLGDKQTVKEMRKGWKEKVLQMKVCGVED